MLKTLASHQDLILLAEIGALIHDLGKLSKKFVTKPGNAHSQILRRFVDLSDPYFHSIDEVRDAALNWIERDLPKVPSLSEREFLSSLIAQMRTKPFTDVFAFASAFLSGASGKVSGKVQELLEDRYLAPITDEESINLSDTQFTPSQLRELLNSEALVDSLRHPAFPTQLRTFGDFIALHHRTYVADRPQLIQLLRAGDDGADWFDSWIDKGDLREQPSQDPKRTLIATAFGYEAWRLPIGPDEDEFKKARYQFSEVLVKELSKVSDGKATPAEVRSSIFAAAETAFCQALGETRRAANDVTLWDHSYSVASLYKAALAKVLLERAIVGEGYEFPAPATIHWRFMRVSVDGLRFFARAHHVTDILGRRRVLKEALDQVRQVVEVKYPLGNEVYRDENGSTFVMPALDNEDAQGKLVREIKELILETFRRTDLGKELVPEVIWNDEGPVRGEMITAFGQLVTQKPPVPTPDPQAMSEWWEDPQARGKEICTVCGMRPIGYDVSKLYGLDEERITYYLEAAEERKVCGVCLHRRGRRAQTWVTDPTEFKRTIWIDEVSDDKGRFALMVGQFVLDDWLDGKLVRTMLVAPGKEKNPSPARIRRCWDTTRLFWLSLVEGHNNEPPELEKVIKQRPFRLRITPAKAAEVNKTLGAYHVYDWPLRGGVTLSVVWVPDGKGGGYFISADNLWYLAGPEQLDFKSEVLRDHLGLLYEFIRVINTQREVALLEPSGYGRPAEVKARVQLGAVIWHPNSAYTPYIPVLAEPATFMALVPADKALAVAQAIKNKYDVEMARVRDRLPLHLGLVFAPRRTPLSAVLEAGRAMLTMPDGWEEWLVAAKGRKATFNRDGRILERQYPAKMGDNETPDIWYPHLLVIDPGAKSELSLGAGDFCYVDNLRGSVYIQPSRFDFEFLDTTARRFEIHYNNKGHRPRRTRPFLLDDLGRLEGLWEELCHLEKSQRYQVIHTIESTREAWFGTDQEGKSLTDPTFHQFVHDTLAGAAWPNNYRWNAIPETMREKLVAAGVAGELADLAELHMQILKE
jgi:hypothetical protein